MHCLRVFAQYRSYSEPEKHHQRHHQQRADVERWEHQHKSFRWEVAAAPHADKSAEEKGDIHAVDEQERTGDLNEVPLGQRGA